MFSVVSAFLFVARIDGQPESEGALSLMQYVAESEFDAALGCYPACSSSTCGVAACKNCAWCQTPTPAPRPATACKSFCTAKYQCTWGTCKDCSFCPQETEGCKSWCSAKAGPWDQKCKINACSGCEPCPEPTPARADCKPWCKPNKSPWNQKCKLDACKGCEPCPEPTPSQGGEARKPTTPEPTEPTTPEPTPAPTAAATPAPPTPQPTNMNYYTVGWLGGGIGEWGGDCTCPDGQVYGVGDYDNSCGSMACINGFAGYCNRYKGPWQFGQVICGGR